MCGEIDEQVQVGQELLDRAGALARLLGLPKPGETAGAAPTGLAEADGRAAYMEQVFRTSLSGALADVARAEEDEAVDALAAQAIALARLAGFLAGQLPAEADLFRAVIEAVADGHGEARDLARAADTHDHHHHHHHHHEPHQH